jgi:hypothetical protein
VNGSAFCFAKAIWHTAALTTLAASAFGEGMPNLPSTAPGCYLAYYTMRVTPLPAAS